MGGGVGVGEHDDATIPGAALGGFGAGAGGLGLLASDAGIKGKGLGTNLSNLSSQAQAVARLSKGVPTGGASSRRVRGQGGEGEGGQEGGSGAGGSATKEAARRGGNRSAREGRGGGDKDLPGGDSMVGGVSVQGDGGDGVLSIDGAAAARRSGEVMKDSKDLLLVAHGHAKAPVKGHGGLDLQGGKVESVGFGFIPADVLTSLNMLGGDGGAAAGSTANKGQWKERADAIDKFLASVSDMSTCRQARRCRERRCSRGGVERGGV